MDIASLLSTRAHLSIIMGVFRKFSWALQLVLETNARVNGLLLHSVCAHPSALRVNTPLAGLLAWQSVQFHVENSGSHSRRVSRSPIEE